MIELRLVDGQFEAKGTIDWGLAGVSENKEFGTEHIWIEDEYEELIYGIKEKDDYRGLWKNFDGLEVNEENVTKKLEEYCNCVIEVIESHHQQLNDYFLFELILQFVETGYPFWEEENALLGDITVDEDDVYTDDFCNKVYQIDSQLYEIENKKISMDNFNVDMVQFIKENLPMFNVDGLMNSIENHVTSFCGDFFTVEFSDTWRKKFYCCAVTTFDIDLCPCNWDNL